MLNYETSQLASIFPDAIFYAKCFDDDAPNLQMMRRRGRAGTAALWNKSIDSILEILPDGTDRVMLLRLKDKRCPVLFINSYMPTMGSTDPDYLTVLDEVHEILLKYRNHQIVWTGDLNADILRRRYQNDGWLYDFMDEHDLNVSQHQPSDPTFHHFNGRSTSRLDLVIEKKGHSVIDSISLDRRNPLNTSAHDAVLATLNTVEEVTITARPSDKLASPAKRIKWERVDYRRYAELTHKRVHILQSTADGIPNDVLADQLNDILLRSALEASPARPKKKSNRKRPWNPSLKPLVRNIKALHYRVKTQLDCPKNHPDQRALKAAKKTLRRTQRQLAATRRNDVKTSIIQAAKKKDRREFFALVKRQRSANLPAGNIEFGNHTVVNNQPDSWANYFESLASPATSDTFDEEYAKHLEIMHTLYLLNTSNKQLPVVTPDDISTIVGNLKSGKAADIFGVTAEHLKMASSNLLELLSHLCNSTIKTGRLPMSCKIGILSPILKKGKSYKDPNGYRRITITSLVGKVIEKYMLDHTNPVLNHAQSPTQFGFTEGCSPMYASLVLTEILAEAKDAGTPLILTFLDASKAFDIVNHHSMLNSLYEQGIVGDLWNLYSNLYEGIQSVVKWEGSLSRVFKETQGIRQGGISSPALYKAERNKGLLQLAKTPTLNIGHINVGAVMVADDLALAAANQEDMQTALSIAELDASRERYIFNTDKTKSIYINCRSDNPLKLNGLSIGTSTCEKHLGIQRNCSNSNSDTIQMRIRDARRTAYSLMGAGLCGLNGTGPEVAITLYATYVLPQLLYGLETLVLTEKELATIEVYHRRNLRCILHLPESTAIPALHLLSGCAPVEALLHIRILTLFRNIADRNEAIAPSVFIHALIGRQIAVKDSTSSSWAALVRKVLHRYHLPDAYSIYTSPPSKNKWKTLVWNAVLSQWTDKIKEQSRSMSSLKMLNLDKARLGSIHKSLTGTVGPSCVQKTTISTKLLVRRYPLKTNWMAGKQSSDLCPLCRDEPEDEEHFLLRCSGLIEARIPLLKEVLHHFNINRLSIDPQDLVRFIIDTEGHSESKHLIDTCRNLKYVLHNRRSTLLADGKKDKVCNPIGC